MASELGSDGKKSAERPEVVRKTPSPYDLNSNDNPGSIIPQVQLRGENYDEWAKTMRTSLRARRKWGFVEGTIKKPEESSPEMEDWWTVQSMVVSWILNTIETSLRSTISYMENAKELWDDIKERLSVANGPRIQQLKSELAECKQEGMSMANYYGKLKALWDELGNYQQIPTCTCEGCKCNIKAKLVKQREEEKVHQFLMGLDDVLYGTTRSSLLATDPLPPLNRVYATLVQEERVKAVSRTKEERTKIVGLAVQTDKREAPRALLNFIALVEKQNERQVKMIRSDNGTEFTCLRTQFNERGIMFQTSCTGTPQQNGRVERKHRHILNVARALRFQGNLPISFLGECILTAEYLINRTPTPLLNGKCPYEVLNGKPPTYEHLRVFGSLCYAHNQGRKGDKFASRSRKCVFVGYPHGKKGWKLFDLDTNTYFVSRDVDFFEAEFPFGQEPVISSSELTTPMIDGEVIVNDENVDMEEIISAELPREESHDDVRGGKNLETEQAITNEENEEQLGRDKRTKIPSVKLRDCVTNTVQISKSPSNSSSTSQHQSKVRYPIAHYTNCEKFSLQHRKFLAAVTADREPMSFAEAMKDSR
ncbi:hypothetical protein TSUD_281100 [Trifolium subterraneum]|uniref:Integrase catalytic domain-containing protein n=1 Tax=Trifolium subterraneum TaxID=3900 RepID=A0A2Z6PPB8_TRISU|nr:hypothetical protein TSUD_281100 [Trifolium subterraneum]